MPNLNNSTLSPDSFHENAPFNRGNSRFWKKNIGISLLVWSPIRKSRGKAFIKLRIFRTYLLGNN